MLIRLSPMILDPAAAVEADVFVAEHGKPWRAPTWLTVHDVAVILCPSGGELNEKNQPYCRLGNLADGENSCVECKGLGYMFVGL
jgi:hypothetical protein